MHNPSATFSKPQPSFYSESEAAAALGISLRRLHLLLDENIFNDGSERPENIRIYPADLVILEYWNSSTENPKIVRMPNR